MRGEMKSIHIGGREHVQLETFSIVYLRRYRELGERDTQKEERDVIVDGVKHLSST